MRSGYKVMGMFLLACSVWAGARGNAGAEKNIKVQQTACDENAVTVTWNAVKSADHYKCTLTDGENMNTVSDVTDTENTFTGLSAGSSYQVSIQAYKGDEVLAESSSAYEVVTTPDIQNYEVTQTNAHEKTVTIYLQGAVGANYYFVKKTGTNGEQVADGETKKDTKKITIKGLKANKTYTFKVYAVRKSAGDFYAYNKKSYKKITVKTMNEKVPLDQFDNISMDFDNDRYTFEVDGSSYLADGYEFQLRTIAGEEKKLLTSKGFKKVLVEDMIIGHFYKYRVRTYFLLDNKKIYSKWSEDKYIGVGEKASGTIYSTKIKIKWTKVIDATGYEISASLDGKNYSTIRTVSASSARKFTITRIGGYSIRRNRKYYVKIRPVTKDGNQTIRSEYTCDLDFKL